VEGIFVAAAEVDLREVAQWTGVEVRGRHRGTADLRRQVCSRPRLLAPMRYTLTLIAALAALLVWLSLAAPDRVSPNGGSSLGRPAMPSPLASPLSRSDLGDGDRGIAPEAGLAEAPVSALRFVIRGVSGVQRGTVTTLFRTSKSCVSGFPLPTVSVPVVGDIRRIEFLVDGYGVALFDGPFSPANDDITVVDMLRSGDITVDVRDSTGTGLPDRVVHCDLTSAGPPEGRIRYRTGPWATTDSLGRAHIENVLPGEYSVFVQEFAEWRSAKTFAKADAGLASHCDLRVPTWDRQRYGGVVLPIDTSPFLTFTSGGSVRYYRLWADGGRSYDIFRTGQVLRCVVPGEPGRTVAGRVQRRNAQGGLEPGSHQSDVVILTIGAVVSWSPTWSLVEQ
jgi:hypothetical protein